LKKLHRELLVLTNFFVSSDCSNELLAAIKGSRSRTKKNGNAGTLLSAEIPFVSILQCTPEMVQDVYKDENPERIEAEIEKLSALHAKTTSHGRLAKVERVLKPGKPWELNRQPKLRDFKFLLQVPLQGEQTLVIV
jgi:hypothetical protein